MNKRVYLKRIGISAVISLLTIAFVTNNIKGKPASYGVYALFSGALLNPKSSVLSLLLVLLPTLLLSYCLTDCFLRDYSSCCVYIFTRSGSRAAWFVKKAAGLLLGIVCFLILEFFLLLAVVVWSGPAVDFSATMAMFGWTLLFGTLSMFMVLLPVNLLAVKAGTVIAYLAGVGGYLVLLFAAIYAPLSFNWLTKLSPVSQGMYAWHQTPFVSQQSFFQTAPLPDFTILFSLIYLIIFIGAELTAGILIINQMDLLTVPEGEN